MNLNELKVSWEKLYGEGLNVHDQDDIKKLIINGTSTEVDKINKELFVEMSITAITAIVSTVAIVFFYFFYDPIKYPWIDVSKLVPIQLIAVTILITLFLSSFAEYRLVNKKFSPDTVKEFISATIAGSRKYYWIFTAIIMVLLFCLYLLVLNYFIAPESTFGFIMIVIGSILMTAFIYLVIRYYYKSNFKAHYQNLQSYLDELKD